MRLFGISTTLFLLMALSSVVYSQNQSGSVNISGYISGTVALSVAPNASIPSNVQMNVVNTSNSTVTIFLAGTGSQPTEVSIPVQIRSNVGFEISALLGSNGSILSNLQVDGARPTGRFVAVDAVEKLRASAFTDNRVNQSLPLLSGSRISMAGSLTSPHNAIEIMLTATIKPVAGEKSWTAEITLSSSPQR
jgi:hypothetical protein